MPRRKQFTVDAESVQDEPGATITFRCLKVGEADDYRSNDVTATEFLVQHIVTWAGVKGDNGEDLPSPADEPGIVAALYLHERDAMLRLLWQGPDGESAKN